MIYFSQKAALLLCVFFSLAAMLLGFSSIVFSGSSQFHFFAGEFQSSRPSSDLEPVSLALERNPYDARLWVRLAHRLKMNGAEASEIEGALNIAEMLSPALKYDVRRHRAYLLNDEVLP